MLRSGLTAQGEVILDGLDSRGALDFFFFFFFFFFCGCVPPGFQNVGSRERIFLEKWESWERKFGKIWV